MQTMCSPPSHSRIAAADQGGHRCHRGGRSIPAVLRRQHRRHRHSFREASRIAQPYARDGGRPYCDRYPHARQATHSCRPGASRDGVERIRSVGIVPSALDAKTLPSNDEPINATIQEESTDKEAGAGDTPSPTNSVPASFEAPNEPATGPNDPELADSLGLADPQEIDEGNCCVLAALDHTEVIDAANIEVAAANQRPPSRPSSHFPNPSKSSFCHRARSWPQHCSPCWAPRILETKLKRSRLSTLQPPLNCVYTPLPQTEARPWNSMATHFYLATSGHYARRLVSDRTRRV